MNTEMAELEITYLKNGCGFKARCSVCKKLLRYARGCNRPGMAYAEAGAKEDFEKHIKKCFSKVVKEIYK